MMLSNPMLIQMDPDTESYTYAGHPGVIKHGKDSDKWEIGPLMAEKILSKGRRERSPRQRGRGDLPGGSRSRRHLAGIRDLIGPVA